ncbi:1695_t:CDS:1, partial [Scutellospora calospora]
YNQKNMSASPSLSLQQSQFSQLSSQFLYRLSHDLTELLDEGDDYNVLIEVGDSPNNKVFKLHSVILRHRSPYFRRKLADFSNVNDKFIEIKKKHVKANVFQIIV